MRLVSVYPSLFACLALCCAKPSEEPKPPEAAPPSVAPPPTASTNAPHGMAAPTDPDTSQDEHDAHHHHAGKEHQHQHAHGSGGYDMDFSEVERFARHFDDPKRDAWQRPDEVVIHLKLSPGQHVADIGAGTGYFLERLSRAVGDRGQVLALDVEPNMVVYMQERVKEAGLGNVEAKRVPPDDAELSQESIDRILIVNTWHHIGQREAYSKKLYRALRPGGFVLIVDFTLDSDIGPPQNHRLTPEQVKAELAAGGLSAEIIAGEKLPKQYLVRGTREAN